MAIDIWRTRPYTLANALDRLFGEGLTPDMGGEQGSRGSDAGMQSLPVNVWEAGDGYHAAVLAPGLDEATLNVTVHEDTLVIEGELRVQQPENAKMVWQEFGPSKFRRSIRLGAAVDAAKVEALYKHGLLVITLPKAEHAKPRQVQVQLGEGKGK